MGLPKTAEELARHVFNKIVDDCDGAGLVVTDTSLLTEQLADLYDVDPVHIYEEYVPSDEESDDDEPEDEA